jgi:hypothetical protein
MKITRRQLRRLIETRIKPNIPNVPSEELLGKIDNFARDKEMQADADVFAGSFGYPEDRSYVKDLETYDIAGRETFDTVSVKPAGQTEDEVVTVGIPYKLVDELVRRHKKVVQLESQGISMYDMAAHTFNAFREAGVDIFRHIHDRLDDKYGRNGYDIYSYGFEGADGYLADKYEKAMEKVGEYL